MKKEIQINELKEIQLNILDTVDDFCKLNNITYYLACGTLLGAIRHKGYIPWDDDIDIAMPRPDYLKFLESFKAVNLEALSIYNTKKCPFPYAKVMDIRTQVVEDTNIKQIIGVNIDIFPLDGLPTNIKSSNWHFYKLLFYSRLAFAKTLNASKRHSLYKNTLLYVTKIIASFFPTHYLICKINKLGMKYDYVKSDYAGIVVFPVGLTERFIKKGFEPGGTAEFCGKQYPIPVGYDAWMRNIYGDYMQFPPKEKQVSNHSFKAYWL